MGRGTHILALVLGLMLVFIGGSAFAQQDQKMQTGQGYAQGYGQMDPEKLQQMRNIQAEHADTIYGLRSQLFAKQRELSAAMAGEQVNAEQVRSVVKEINNLRGKLFSARMEMQLEMRQKGLMPSYGAYGMGYGMMGSGMMQRCGMSPGMMHGMGRGMGPGMMRGGGMGPGMMGPGMMHGRGMGPGMMHGGRGMGPGMMGPGMHGGQGMGPGMMYGNPYQQNY